MQPAALIHPASSFSPATKSCFHPQVQEAKSSRTQRVEGTVIAMAGSGSNRTMVVRRIFQGVGVEMSILMHSPVLSSIEIVRRGKVRR